ncbi:MAG TPA: alkaline phosphatase family protein [Beutenbergiaceae bacterium]|nr:alkaline phosphatase family protein [Beutenbergiaceae bacterium]
MLTGTGAEHLLVVGFDGVRYDTLQAAHTPVLDDLSARGVLLPVQVDRRNPTISGPVWSTVATGVNADRHGVLGNGDRPRQREQFADFLQVLRQQRPGVDTFVAASWPPIVARQGPGPIFAQPGWQPGIDREADEDVPAASRRADDAVLAYAVEQLRTREATAAFVYFGEVDEYGHWRGTGEGYTTSIERCDQRLGELLATIDARPARAQEEWTVVVVTDHGHVDGGGHGGESELERTAWIAAAGPGVGAVSALCHGDIAAHAAQLFDLSMDVEGVPFGER